MVIFKHLFIQIQKHLDGIHAVHKCLLDKLTE